MTPKSSEIQQIIITREKNTKWFEQQAFVKYIFHACSQKIFSSFWLDFSSNFTQLQSKWIVIMLKRVSIGKHRKTYNFRVWYGNKKIFDLKKKFEFWIYTRVGSNQWCVHNSIFFTVSLYSKKLIRNKNNWLFCER